MEAMTLLPRINVDATLAEPPAKRIHDASDMPAFRASLAYERLVRLITMLNAAAYQAQWNENHDELSEHSDAIIKLLHTLRTWISETPPATGPRRFGNIAFRTWAEKVEKHSAELVGHMLAPDEPETVINEIAPYLSASFGSKPRLDYGTGHELSFLAFLGSLFMTGYLEAPRDAKSVALRIIPTYLDVVRSLVTTYTLEPAGSHGVWGLDDHSFIPYILGSSQLVDLPRAPRPSAVTNRELVEDLKDKNLYFGAVAFINSGPFFEHSPVLFDVSGVPLWKKVNQGMQKMYIAEVLDKFPVVQHFVFGPNFYPFSKSPNFVDS